MVGSALTDKHNSSILEINESKARFWGMKGPHCFGSMCVILSKPVLGGCYSSSCFVLSKGLLPPNTFKAVITVPVRCVSYQSPAENIEDTQTSCVDFLKSWLNSGA